MSFLDSILISILTAQWQTVQGALGINNLESFLLWHVDKPYKQIYISTWWTSVLFHQTDFRWIWISFYLSCTAASAILVLRICEGFGLWQTSGNFPTTGHIFLKDFLMNFSIPKYKWPTDQTVRPVSYEFKFCCKTYLSQETDGNDVSENTQYICTFNCAKYGNLRQDQENNHDYEYFSDDNKKSCQWR